MKRIILMTAMLFLALSPLSAQRLVIGERAPELKIQKWLTAVPSTEGKFVMVEFFHSSNKKSVERLSTLNTLAKTNAEKLAVIIITRESDPAVTSVILNGNPSYYVGLDEGGKIFSAYSAQYVPYSVVSDKKQRILWVGNPTSMSNEDVLQLIK